MMLPIVIFISALTTLSTLILAVPLTDFKNNLNRNAINNVVSPCSANEACWEVLPVKEEIRGNIPMEEVVPKIHTRREAASVDPNTIIDSWGESAPVIDKRADALLQNAKQTKNKLPKKDVIMSRSWGAGGMPFSVLYMSPHSLRTNYASSAQQEVPKTNDASTPSATHPDYRITLRNGGSSQPRRQYSIIPQLFISYGWGPFGK
ncbi:uncharacterized protein LOC117222668 [Megalopta genalis]|uniref:uncharacterized protein LOC117222668 n=1 Tax=Megalopta genalis TaxID=115081 RepID=UPI0014431080|nr:uncharacterized protein LOC117222668 [Megalopta genalis]